MDSAFVQRAIEEIRLASDTKGIGAGAKLAQRYAAQEPDNPVLQAEWAEHLLWTGETAEALRVATRAVELDRYCAQAHAVLADHAALTGSPDDAMRHYLHAYDLDPFAPETLVAGMNAFTVTGDAEEALACARSFAGKFPESPRAWSALHYALRSVGEHGEAEEQIQNASPAIKTTGTYFVAVARHRLMQADAVNAEPAAREAVRLSPESNGAWSTLAMTLEFLSQIEDAVDAAAQALEINCHDAIALRIIQRVAQQQGETALASQLGARADEANAYLSGDGDFYRIQELIEQGEYQAALATAVELEKTISSVHAGSLRATILFLMKELGRWEELESKLNHLSAFEEFDADCHSAAAALALHRGDAEGALEMLRIGLERFPASSLLRSQYLVALGQHTRIEELEAATADVLTLHIGNPAAYSELVDGLYEAGQTDAALELLRRGLDRFPDDDMLGLLALSIMLGDADSRAA